MTVRTHAAGLALESEFEYELVDTGIFAEDRYFDVEVEYAKAGPEDILTRITVHNRGPEEATVHLLPTVWFRATDVPARLRTAGATVVQAEHDGLGTRWWTCLGEHQLLFTENADGRKDAIGRYLIEGDKEAVNADGTGTKAAAVVTLTLPAGGTSVVRARLSDRAPTATDQDEQAFDEIVEARRAEADEFYSDLFAPALSEPERQVARQAMAGMLWSKQHFGYDVERWLREHGRNPLDAPGIRNGEWFHLDAHDIISMPDTWEYPWFAAWDLAFQAVAFSLVDVAFAKSQLELLLTRRYLHPNGQIPAYEWNFSDVNPPVHAWAAYLVYELEKARTGKGDQDFLERVFHKLSKNFTWWVNRKDMDGRNVFQGGFLGLDNIGVFDRSAPLPTGGHLDQADGTAWMALYCQNMLQIALELGDRDPVYLEEAQTYLEHFAWIAAAVHGVGGGATMWDEEDGFFYDLLRAPDGSAQPLRVRSMVGLLPLAAATVYDKALLDRHPQIITEAMAFLDRHEHIDIGGRHGRLLALFDEQRLRRILARMLDENEFLSPYGIRAVSRYHAEHPFEFRVGDQLYSVSYQPAESENGMFGGNSNWRGPIWFPVNALMIRALLNLYVGYGDDFTMECPTGSGQQMTLFEVAQEISGRLTGIFLPDEQGHRPCYGGNQTFAGEHWRDLMLFSEYFHGDNGAGIGAAHQTGWTGLVAVFPNLFAGLTGKDLIDNGMSGVFREASLRKNER